MVVLSLQIKVETKQMVIVFILRYCMIVIVGQMKQTTQIVAALVWYVINKSLWLYGCGDSAGQDRNKTKLGFIHNVVLCWHHWLEETLSKCGYISMVEVCCHCSRSGKYQHKYWLYWSVSVVSSLLVRIEAKTKSAYCHCWSIQAK